MANYIRRLIKILNDNDDKLVLGGSIIGANIGVFSFIKDSPEFNLGEYSAGVIFGGAAGACVGLLSPLIIPGLILGVPGYGIAKIHSSLQASQRKVETLVDQTDLSNKTKEVLRASRLY